MTRYLPILMLALGLFLVSASFASVRAAEPRPAATEFCAELSAQPAVDREIPEELGRCWKKMGLGALIPGCHGPADIVRVEQPFVPDTHGCWPAPMDLVVDDGPPPLLDIPPPRA